jgi:hypothetical protein
MAVAACSPSAATSAAEKLVAAVAAAPCGLGGRLLPAGRGARQGREQQQQRRGPAVHRGAVYPRLARRRCRIMCAA